MREKLQRGIIWLISSRIRLGVTSLVVIVGLLLWARLMMVSNLPRTAIAEDETPVKAAGGVEKGVESDKAGAKSTQVNIAPTPNPDPPHVGTVGDSESRPNSLMFREAEKSDPRGTEDAQDRDSRNPPETIRLALDGMRLGRVDPDRGLATIDGRERHVGERIEAAGSSGVSLTLAEVRSHSVILECQGRRYELNNARP